MLPSDATLNGSLRERDSTIRCQRWLPRLAHALPLAWRGGSMSVTANLIGQTLRKVGIPLRMGARRGWQGLFDRTACAHMIIATKGRLSL